MEKAIVTRHSLVAASLTLLAWAAAARPAQAWWIFKHHHHQSDEAGTGNGLPPTQPSLPPQMVSPPLRPLNWQNSFPTRKFLPADASAGQSRLGQTAPSTTPALAPMPGIPTAPDRSANITIVPSRLKTTSIRVGLATGINTAEIVALDGAMLKEFGSGNNLAALSAQTRWSVKLERQCLVMNPKDWFQLTYPYRRNFLSEGFDSCDSRIRPATYRVSNSAFQARSFDKMSLRFALGAFGNDRAFVLVPNSVDGQPGLFGINGKFYRGNLIVLPQLASGKVLSFGTPNASAGFNLINEVNLDDYLLGVVPAEMPSSWPPEALKAQAIAARTYAYANLGKHAKDGFDVVDTTDDQVYSGIKAETSSSNAAVCATSGVVMTYQGNPICAYFHSASGGITENPESVWGKPLPYLRAVMDYDQQSPHALWNRSFSVDQLESALAPDLGKLLSIDVVSRSQSKRAYQLLVIGSRGAQITNAETVRRLLKLPSTNFNVSCLDNAYLFTGRGFGHGLGLSQWGAKGLAEQGYNAPQILTYYYRNVSLERLVDVPNH
jgi:SpoIID/LytB domain protein